MHTARAAAARATRAEESAVRYWGPVAAGCILAELLGQRPLFPGNDYWQSAKPVAAHGAPAAVPRLGGYYGVLRCVV